MAEIFDRKLLKQNQRRSLPHLHNHSFLYHEIANRIVENLEFFNRNFAQILEIGARDDFFTKKIKEIYPLSALENHDDNEILTISQNKKFDLILSNLNLQHINAIPQFLLQIKNLLSEKGVFIASFFGEENLRELHETIFHVENKIYQGVSPRMIPTIDIKTAAMLLQKAGFNNAISSLERVDVVYSDPINLLRDLKFMGQGNAMHKRSRRFFTRRFLAEILQFYRENYQCDGGVKASFDVVIFSGSNTISNLNFV